MLSGSSEASIFHAVNNCDMADNMLLRMASSALHTLSIKRYGVSTKQPVALASTPNDPITFSIIAA